MSADVSVEQKPQGGSGFAAPWNPQFSPTVDTPLPPAFSPPSAPYGPPIPLSQSPDNQEPGTRWIHLHLFVSETVKQMCWQITPCPFICLCYLLLLLFMLFFRIQKTAQHTV